MTKNIILVLSAIALIGIGLLIGVYGVRSSFGSTVYDVSNLVGDVYQGMNHTLIFKDGIFQGAPIATTTAISIGSTLDVTGATTLGSTLGVTGATSLAGLSFSTASSTGLAKLDSLIVGQLNGGLSVSSAGALSASSTMKIYGASSLLSTLAVTSLSSLNGGLAVTGPASVTATTTLSSGLILGKSALCIDAFATSTQTAVKISLSTVAATGTSPVGFIVDFGSCN